MEKKMKKNIYIYKLSHFAIQQKLTQYLKDVLHLHRLYFNKI